MINDKVWIINKKFLVILSIIIVLIVSTWILFSVLATAGNKDDYFLKDTKVIICKQ